MSKFPDQLSEYLYTEGQPVETTGSSSEGVGWGGMYQYGDNFYVLIENCYGEIGYAECSRAEISMVWEDTKAKLAYDEPEPEPNDYVIQLVKGKKCVYVPLLGAKYVDLSAATTFITKDMKAKKERRPVWLLDDDKNFKLWEDFPGD